MRSLGGLGRGASHRGCCGACTGSGKTGSLPARHRRRCARAGAARSILVPEISLTHQLVGPRSRALRRRRGGAAQPARRRRALGRVAAHRARRGAHRDRRALGGLRAAARPRRQSSSTRSTTLCLQDRLRFGVHYHGRDVAVMRAKLSGCPLILGSATPSMESFFNATQGRYRSARAARAPVEARPLPPVSLLDLRTERRRSRVGSARPPSSPRAHGGQSRRRRCRASAVLNRRGFGRTFCSAVRCGRSGHVSRSRSVTLTCPPRRRALRCHYCDHTVRAADALARAAASRHSRPGASAPEQLEALLRERLHRRASRAAWIATRRGASGSQEALLRALGARAASTC